MDTDKWIYSRIMWKANQNNLLSGNCVEYSAVPAEVQYHIETYPSHGLRVLLFYSSPNLWTLLTTREIASFYEGYLHAIPLNQIKSVGFNKSLDLRIDNDDKETLDRLYVNGPHLSLWAPPGKEAFALLGILRMFPMKRGNQRGRESF